MHFRRSTSPLNGHFVLQMVPWTKMPFPWQGISTGSHSLSEDHPDDSDSSRDSRRANIEFSRETGWTRGYARGITWLFDCIYCTLNWGGWNCWKLEYVCWGKFCSYRSDAAWWKPGRLPDLLECCKTGWQDGATSKIHLQAFSSYFLIGPWWTEQSQTFLPTGLAP